MLRSLGFVWWRRFGTLLNLLPKLSNITHSLECEFCIIANAVLGYVYSQLKQLWNSTTRACSTWTRERLSRHSERCYPELRLGQPPTIRDTLIAIPLVPNKLSNSEATSCR